MWEFLDRLISLSIPVSVTSWLMQKASTAVATTPWVLKSTMFPEIDYDKIDKIRGLDIVITTSANTDDEGRACAR